MRSWFAFEGRPGGFRLLFWYTLGSLLIELGARRFFGVGMPDDVSGLQRTFYIVTVLGGYAWSLRGLIRFRSESASESTTWIHVGLIPFLVGLPLFASSIIKYQLGEVYSTELWISGNLLSCLTPLALVIAMCTNLERGYWTVQRVSSAEVEVPS